MITDPNDRTTVEALIRRVQANPAAAQADLPRIEAILSRYGTASAAEPATDTPAEPMATAPTIPAWGAKKDVRNEAELKAQGDVRGKANENMFQDLQRTGVAAKNVAAQLNTMEELYKRHGDAIPSGELAPMIKALKSSAESLGIKIEGAGETDVLRSIGTEQALKARTADGENLLPGAMSNYEDQLLQAMSPGLAMTREGRMLMIQISKVQLQMKSDLAAAAREYYRNKGRLDSGWWDVAAKYAEANPLLKPERIAAIEAYAKRLTSGAK